MKTLDVNGLFFQLSPDDYSWLLKVFQHESWIFAVFWRITLIELFHLCCAVQIPVEVWISEKGSDLQESW